MYDETKPKAVGRKLVELIEAIAEDGPGVEDMNEFMALVTALVAAQTEFRDTDAAVFHLLSGATDAYGDTRVDVA